MKKFLLLTALCLVTVPASQVSAQTLAPETTKTNPNVFVVGAVGKPGVFPFLLGEKVAALLERAGGTSSVASPTKTYVLRDGLSISLDLSQIKENSPQLVLREGDVLVVPENSRRIAVIGSVARPGFFALPEQKVSVIDALILAGGMISNPDDVKIGILRANSANADVSVEWHSWIEDSNLLSHSLLQDGDAIYVQRIAPKHGALQLLDKS